MSKKIYVLDTNVLLSDPNAIYAFKNNDIILPFKVLEELDKKKTNQELLGSNARHIIRELDVLRNKGNLSQGVKIDKGKGVLTIKGMNPNILPEDFMFSADNSPDLKIIAVAYSEKINNPEQKVIIVSRDINVRIMAQSLGIIAENFELDQAVDKKENIYSGFKQILVDDQVIDNFYAGKEIRIEEEEHKCFPHQFIMLVSNSDNKKSALAKFVNYSTPLKKTNDYKQGIYGLKSRNKEQTLALNLLMDPKITVVSLLGLAGGGKTLLALAAGLEQTIEKEVYKKLIVIRPVQPLGKDLGFLPGSMQDKLSPFLQPIVDNLQNLFHNDRMILDEFVDKGIIELCALTYIRGRSISNAYIILDECQSLTRHELKSVLTRCGDNTKIVITGDLGQIDNIYMNETTSGLTVVVEKLKNQELVGHISLVRGERSATATMAAKLL